MVSIGSSVLDKFGNFQELKEGIRKKRCLQYYAIMVQDMTIVGSREGEKEEGKEKRKQGWRKEQ